MWMDKVKAKIGEQKKVYEALKKGDESMVCYKEFENGTWGTDDANYTNRLRLSCYLLYFHVEDEETVSWLFKEEIKDRERNSFQGIGFAIRVLSHLLQKYNGDGKYEELFKRAKDANFDCACGYDPKDSVEEDLEKLDILDCIYLCWRLEYKDVMGSLVDEWKKETVTWNRENRTSLINFNIFLDRNAENENLYKAQLEEALEAEKQDVRDVMCGYLDLIQYYLHMGDHEKAVKLCWTVIREIDYGQCRRIHLFRSFIESCFEAVAAEPSKTEELWSWARTEFQRLPKAGIYGNLYKKGIAAAKAQKDPCWEEMEQRYKQEFPSLFEKQ